MYSLQSNTTYNAFNVCAPPRPSPSSAVAAAVGVGKIQRTEVADGDDDAKCSVRYTDLPQSQIVQYELLQTKHKTYRFVSEASDGLFDASYYNGELRRCILLGRFTDPRTAALAHAISRKHDNVDCRTTPFAAQRRIHDMYRQQREREQGR